MRNLIKLFFTPFISFISFASLAQEINIEAVSENAPLPYANITINSKLIGYADSLGVFNIKDNELKAGDTIKVNYLSAKETTAIYNGKDKNIVIELKSRIELDEITVKGLKDPIKFFKKDVKFHNFTTDYAAFEMNIDIISSALNNYNGANISLIYNHSNRIQNKQFKHLNSSFANDSTSILRVAQTFKAVTSFVPQNYGIKKVREYDVSYIGKKDNNYQFSIIYKLVNYSQCIYSVNADTKAIVHIESFYANQKHRVYSECSINMSPVNDGRYYITDFIYNIKTTNYNFSIIAKDISTTDYKKEYQDMHKNEKWTPLYPPHNK